MWLSSRFRINEKAGCVGESATRFGFIYDFGFSNFFKLFFPFFF